jgi:iron complex transport system substrate-binding protein
VAKRPGWDKLSAVHGKRVHALDDDIASRWGPRVVDLLRIAVDAAGKATA